MITRPLAIVILVAATALPALAQPADVASLEAKAKELFAKKAHVHPPGENVVDVCKEIIKVDPTNATATDLLTKVTSILVNTGDGKLRKRDFKGALGSYDQALSLDSGNAKARAGRDKARQGLEKEKFEVEGGKAPEYYMAKGNELFDQGDYVRARKYYLAILRTIPDDPFAKTRERDCAVKLGIEVPAAAPATPQDPAAKLSYYREAAAQLEKSGDWAAALSYYKQIVAAAPDDAQAKAGLERAEDQVGGFGRLRLASAGATFWWSAKVKTPDEAKAALGITVKVLADGKEVGTFTDAIIEDLKLGDVSRNELAFPLDFSVRVPNPGSNVVAVQIHVGGEKPRSFGGQATLSLQPGQVLAATVEGTSSLKLGSGFSKKMTGEFSIAIKPATAAP
jgi:tetratricopeptide (TPR) repeat protein